MKVNMRVLIGHDINASSLRQIVISYLRDHGEFYSHFVHTAVASNDIYNADNEALDEEDAVIESIADPDQQRELRWQKYLRHLSRGAWSDSTAIAATCNLFDVSIDVYCANASGTSIAKMLPMFVLVPIRYALASL